MNCENGISTQIRLSASMGMTIGLEAMAGNFSDSNVSENVRGDQKSVFIRVHHHEMLDIFSVLAGITDDLPEPVFKSLPDSLVVIYTDSNS